MLKFTLMFTLMWSQVGRTTPQAPPLPQQGSLAGAVRQQGARQGAVRQSHKVALWA
jgi:hypothetical protein